MGMENTQCRQGDAAEMSQALVLRGLPTTLTQGCSKAGALLWESGGVLVSGTGDRETCVGGNRLGGTGTTGTTLTLYLERSDSIERRNTNRLSAPLQHPAASGKRQLRIRSIGADPALHTAENGNVK